MYCSEACVEADDQRAFRLKQAAANVQADVERQRAVIEADIASYATMRRRVLAASEADYAQAAREADTLQAKLAEARAVGEVRGQLLSERPAIVGYGSMA